MALSAPGGFGNTLALCKGEAFFKATSKPDTGMWPVFRVMRKCALDLKPRAGTNPENWATAKGYCIWALRYRLEKHLTLAVKLRHSRMVKELKGYNINWRIPTGICFK
jgi:hypothetical protein